MVMRISFLYSWVSIRYKNNNEWWFIRKKYKKMELMELEIMAKKKQSSIYGSHPHQNE